MVYFPPPPNAIKEYFTPILLGWKLCTTIYYLSMKDKEMFTIEVKNILISILKIVIKI